MNCPIGQSGAGIRRGEDPGRRIPAPPLHVLAPPMRIPAPPLRIPAPVGTILEHLAACL